MMGKKEEMKDEQKREGKGGIEGKVVEDVQKERR
jgi:hypothetical protein